MGILILVYFFYKPLVLTISILILSDHFYIKLPIVTSRHVKVNLKVGMYIYLNGEGRGLALSNANEIVSN